MSTAKPALQILLISLLVALAIPLLSPTHTFYPTAHASAKTISLVGNLVGYYYYWNSTNPTITVTQGDSITLDLSSSDGAPHRFLLDFDGDLYDRLLTVSFVQRLRAEKRFATVPALQQQMAKDVENARRILGGASSAT